MNTYVRNYKILSIVLPIIAVLIAGVFTMTQVTRMKSLQAQKDQVDENIAFLENLMRQDQLQPLADKIPAELMSPEEQAAFLDQLRQLAAASNIQIIRWTNTARKLPNAPKDPNKKEEETPASKVTALMCTIDIKGEYPNMRTFMYSLLRSKRLLNVSSLTWTRTNEYPRTALTFTCTRYVTDEPMPVAPPEPGGTTTSPQVTKPASSTTGAGTKVTASADELSVEGS